MKDIHDSIKIAVRHPLSGAQLFSRTISAEFIRADWIGEDLRLSFCILFMKHLLECDIEPIDEELLCKIETKSLRFGIRLLKRYPRSGMHILAQLIVNELRNTQKFSTDQMIDFHTELLSAFFPGKVPALAET